MDKGNTIVDHMKIFPQTNSRVTNFQSSLVQDRDVVDFDCFIDLCESKNNIIPLENKPTYTREPFNEFSDYLVYLLSDEN